MLTFTKAKQPLHNHNKVLGMSAQMFKISLHNFVEHCFLESKSCFTIIYTSKYFLYESGKFNRLLIHNVAGFYDVEVQKQMYLKKVEYYAMS